MKHSKIKTDTAAAASTQACESRPVTVDNDECLWSACTDNRCAACMRRVRWNLVLVCTIHLTPHREFFDKYKHILIGQRYVTIGNGYWMFSSQSRNSAFAIEHHQLGEESPQEYSPQ